MSETVRVESYIERGVDEGAELVVDGREFEGEGAPSGGFFLGGSLFDPGLHRRHQLLGSSPVGPEKLQIGLLGILDAVEIGADPARAHRLQQRAPGGLPVQPPFFISLNYNIVFFDFGTNSKTIGTVSKVTRQ